MKAQLKNWKLIPALLAVLVATTVAYSTMGNAAERRGRPLKAGEYNSAHETVELFAAMESGELEVRLIPKDSTQANVLITNKTKKPLNVRLPEAFAGVPVLAQMGGMGGMGGGGMGGGGGGGNQGMGGGMGGGGMGGGGMGGGGMGGMGGGGGFFNVPAEKVGKFKVQAFCLDHGKGEPRAAIPYALRPIESYTQNTAVHVLCKMLAEDGIDQRVAQAAAWHLNNNMSWDELAAKYIKRANGARYPYFTQQELHAAMAVTSQAKIIAKERDAEKGKTITSPGSLSQR